MPRMEQVGPIRVPARESMPIQQHLHFRISCTNRRTTGWMRFILQHYLPRPVFSQVRLPSLLQITILNLPADKSWVLSSHPLLRVISRDYVFTKRPVMWANISENCIHQQECDWLQPRSQTKHQPVG